jgi:biopolymer transport protein ExbD
MALEIKRDEPEIPTASMADIAFLLIVFFMLTTVFSANKGIEHVLPKKDDADPAKVEGKESIYIQLFVENQFAMDRKTYTMEQVDEVYNYVYTKLQQNAQKPVIIHSNPQAYYGDFVALVDQVKKVERDLKQPVSLTIPTKEEAEMYDTYGVQ